MIKVAITGATGRISTKIIRSILQQEDMEVVAAIGAPDTQFEGRDVGEAVGGEKIGIPISPAQDLSMVFKETKPDILIDFTVADASVNNIKIAAKYGVNIVVGTTGFTDEQMFIIKELVEKNHLRAVVSPNMAVGVNVFFKIIKDLAKILNEYDIEIIEAHHRHKKDAPSGTAVKAAKIIANELNRDMANVGVYGRKSITGGRNDNEIGVHSVRGGDIVGDHTVLFAGEGERLELVHRAHSRQVFVSGVIKAVRYVVKAPLGKISDMEDVLNLKTE